MAAWRTHQAAQIKLQGSAQRRGGTQKNKNNEAVVVALLQNVSAAECVKCVCVCVCVCDEEKGWQRKRRENEKREKKEKKGREGG